jgi:putative hydrolase of the HAD superfamily
MQFSWFCGGKITSLYHIIQKFFMYPNIKNIIFDFGGVIIDFDFQRSIDAFINLGAINFQQKYSQANQLKIFDRLDTGEISQKGFIKQLKELLPSYVNNQQIMDAWNAILIGIPEKRIRLLEKIKKHYRIFLMSNTNAIHYPIYKRELQEKYGYNNLSDLFEKVYMSFETHLRKPDMRFFKLILTENNLNPSETLFIDDSEQNLPPAKQLGMQALWLKDKEITSFFDKGLLKPECLE